MGEAVVDFRVLGPFEVVDQGVVLQLGGPQQRSVLALLVLRANELVSTDALIQGVWGDAAPETAVGVVRSYVSRLRRTLAAVDGACLASRPPGYLLAIDPDHVDAVRFARLVREGQQATEAGNHDTASTTLARALGLWRGSVLADLPGLDPLRPAITRLEETRVAAMESRFEAELALGHHAEIVGELTAASEEHPFRERLWGQRILALYRSGRQADALATYQKARSTLVERLGVDPGPELRALEQLVLAHASELRWSGLPPRTTVAATAGPGLVPLQAGLAPTSGGTRFVGRADERAMIRKRLDAAVAGQLGAVFVAGPPGIGKSALVRWAARDAHADGVTVVAGWADEGSGVPFQPLDEAVGHWVAHTAPAERARLIRDDASQLARILPALAERTTEPLLSPPPPLGEDGDHRRLLAAVLRWIEALAARGPAVVVLEDLHWADPACLRAVGHVLRHPPAAGVLLLATYRDTEAPGSHPLARLLVGTRGNDMVDHIDLTGLGDDDVVDLVRLVGPVGPVGLRPDNGDGTAGRAFATQLNRRTGGNPLFIHETLRHLTRRGVVDPVGGRWATPEPLAAYGIPPVVTDLIDERLRRLPDPTQALLRTAAVLGQEFDFSLLTRTVDLPGVEVVAELEPALTAQLIVQDEPTRPRFAFAHALVREALLDRLPPSQRARTHWRAGEALAGLSAADPGARLGEVARHLAAGVSAGDPHVALEATVRAGQHALSNLAVEAAFTQFTRAADLLETMPSPDADLAYATWFGLGYASAALGDLDTQHDGLTRAVTVARQRHRPNSLAFLVIGLSAHRMAAGERGLGAELLEELVDEAAANLSHEPSLERCALLTFQAVRAVVRDDGCEARELAASAHDVAAELGTPTTEAMALLAHAWTLVGSPHPHAMRDSTERALRLSLDAVPEARVLLRGFLTPLLALPALQLGNRGDLASVRARVAADAETRRYPHLVASLERMWDGTVALWCGRFDEVPRLADGLDATDWATWQSVAIYQRGVAAIERGLHALAANALRRHLSSLPDAVVMRALLASLLATAGDHGDAAHHVEMVARSQRPVEQLGWGRHLVLRHLAEVVARLHDERLAADLLPVLTPYSGQMLVTATGAAVEAAADRAIGQLLLTLDHLDEAVERLAAAQAQERSMEADALATRTAYWHARALLARGTPDDDALARRLVDQATSDAHRLGMAQLERDLEALPRRSRR